MIPEKILGSFLKSLMVLSKIIKHSRTNTADKI